MRILALIILIFPLLANAAPVELAGPEATFCWSASTTPSVTYNLYIDGGLVNSIPITGTCHVMTLNTLWYEKIKSSVVRAEDDLGIESDNSNTVQFIYKKPAPLAPSNLRVSN